jgi:methylthioribose-1-phosphate isomerase
MNAAQSPLFEPVLWQGEGFRILDETQVPEKIHYIDVCQLDQALGAVREMKTRAFGQVLTFLYSGALLAQNNLGQKPAQLKRTLADMTEQFCAARPTFDFRGLGVFFDGWCDELAKAENAGADIARLARQCAQNIVRARELRARQAAEILPDPAVVLTHCNISGELVALARHCRVLGKQLRVIAGETRPYLQGARLTAWELTQADVPVAVIADAAVAQIMAQGEVNAVVVGADRVARNGDIINKVGTYPVARMASEHGVPFYALVQDPRSLRSGLDVPIEERPADEVLRFQNQALVPGANEGLQARYPSFDVTPARFITRLIGFDEIYTPEAFRLKYGGESSHDERFPCSAEKYVLVHGIPAQSQYSELIDSLRPAAGEKILVPEMRPHLYGARIVAGELLARGVPTTLISDNMMGTLFARGEVRKAVLFFLSFGDGGAMGPCGALLAARLAHLHRIPVNALQGAADLEEIDGILDRDIATFLGKRTCPDGVEIRPAVNELVPWRLLRAG